MTLLLNRMYQNLKFKTVKALLIGFLFTQNLNAQTINVSIDLVNVTDDKVSVTVQVPKLSHDTISYLIPKIVPGTYSISDFGKYIESFRAYDKKNRLLPVTKQGDNRWKIEQAQKLSKITYLVNDTYDIEDQHDIFSPAGSNILADQNYMLNLHAFVGYFQRYAEQAYEIRVHHPENLYGTTATEDNDPSVTQDSFSYDRYFSVTDNPILYAAPDTLSFNVSGIKVELGVYSPGGLHNAEELREPMSKMMQAQKAFLGDINDTPIYSILLYFSDTSPTDAQGFGALEHHNTTVVVLPEAMEGDRLVTSMTDVVSHEFFHILTPLSLHSEQIHYFNFNQPDMSRHLWLYEGVTEYFANLFQVRQGLIDEADFYDRMMTKLYNSLNYNDSLSFTEMSRNILEEPYKDNYANVYEKGAIIGMCLDLIIRNDSDGQKGLLDVMKTLSKKYGKDNPFKDEAFIDEFTELTYPAAGEFLQKHVVGNAPIPYDQLLALAGVSFQNKEVPGGFFIDGNMPYIWLSSEDEKSLYFQPFVSQNNGLKALGVESGDIIKTVNGVAYNIDNVYELITESQTWQEGDEITMVVLRNGQEVSLSGKAEIPMVEVTVLQADELPEDDPKLLIRKAWLKL